MPSADRQDTPAWRSAVDRLFGSIWPLLMSSMRSRTDARLSCSFMGRVLPCEAIKDLSVDGAASGQSDEAPHDHVAIRRLDLETIAASPEARCRQQRRTRPQKRIQNQLARLGRIPDTALGQLDGLLCGMPIRLRALTAHLPQRGRIRRTVE